ncbi:uncharacterized protein LOC118223532 isoform X2 [Anguilla anguilla]|uniref:uncharacterized protein LOC118223532 isoform X2 n=1 Tax=Anguilla anguilla TaxID=7936 RepID=UPI0015B0B718|nr:uncharacterized protein LOC118223532 isoform X2 [Anguilla anguilla]
MGEPSLAIHNSKRGPCVLNIMVSPLIKDESGKIRSYLIDTVILDKCNHSTVANAAVYMAGARKRRYLSFLSTSGKTTRMAPNPCGTRWNLWYMAAAYHTVHFFHVQGVFRGGNGDIQAICSQLTGESA